MHYALPGRKSSSRPPAYAIKPNRNGFNLRSMRPPFVILTALGAISTLFILLRLFGSSIPKTPASGEAAAGVGGSLSGNVVLVTVFDEKSDMAISDFVQENRNTYAKKHGI
jgi:hypothetical protein